MHRLLIANRGEIAVRILDAASALGIETVSVAGDDDQDAPHLERADVGVAIPGSGPQAYLNINAIHDAAVSAGCDGVHPGYGFLSENAQFARELNGAGIVFMGPSPSALESFGDKGRARELAVAAGIPTLAASTGTTSLDEARAFLDGLPTDSAVMLKAIAGGGGRGMAPVRTGAELAAAYDRCSAEALAAFGNGDLYVERLLGDAHHVEIQVVSDGDSVLVAGSRDCSTQRRRQKIIEVAPAVWTPHAVREQLGEAARTLIGTVPYAGLATVEFLVDGGDFYFLEVNPRLQVEHTVTETVTGLDLVEASIRIGYGETLTELGLKDGPVTERGVAIQARVNAESFDEDGTVYPSSGLLSSFEVPSGAHTRVDTYGRVGAMVNPRYDSLLAKVIVDGPDIQSARSRLQRALADFTAGGVGTNRDVLRALAGSEDFIAGRITTAYVDAHLPQVIANAASYAEATRPPAMRENGQPGLDSERAIDVPPDAFAAPAALSGVVVEVPVREGEVVTVGTELYVLEAMKMQHAVVAERTGRVHLITAEVGEFVESDRAIMWLTPENAPIANEAASEVIDLDRIRPDLAESLERHRFGLDEGRPDVVAERHDKGRMTARESIAELIDPGSFVEYGALAIAAQRRRRAEQDLIQRTPGDGIVLGTATVDEMPIAVFAYDYTVMAGTQGFANHRKMDRLFRIADDLRLPIVIFAEGGGGRPGDTDKPAGPGLIGETFLLLSALAGKVPIVGVVAGYCFAGNAALLGACDVIISTRDSSIGMGGPAMIEGGGLGEHHPADVGPMSVQYPNGVVDVLADDETDAIAECRKVLGLLAADRHDPTGAADQRTLRHLVPEDRLRSYEVRPIMDTLVDYESLIELRAGFGHGIITSLARINGQVVGIIANNPRHLGGAIDAAGSDKAERFLTMLEARQIPVISICDTPGFMVGPESEREATVRRFGAMFVAGARLTVPLIMIVTRKGYGLGAMAMAGGNLHAPVLAVSWPTGEFGGMGLEGAVRLGYRKELDAIEDPGEKANRYDELLAEMYDSGKAVRMAAAYEIDDVIDPADTRAIVIQTLKVSNRC